MRRVRAEKLKGMRLEALRMMRLLATFRPKLMGSVLTGHIRQGSDIDIHVFTDHVSWLTAVLDENNQRYTIQRKRIVKQNDERIFTHVHIQDRCNFELTLYDENKINYAFKSSITGKAIERATIPEVEELLRQEYSGVELDSEVERLDDHIDCFDLYRLLLEPLADVKQNAAYHPEGDALYHSLQVFELARDRRPWDEEFITAALLHDVGKAIDPSDHVAAGLSALEGAITDRTQFLIAHHMDAHAHRDGSLGHRAKLRLQESDDFEDLMLLQELDRAGRRRGVEVCTIAQALEYIRSMEEERY